MRIRKFTLFLAVFAGIILLPACGSKPTADASIATLSGDEVAAMSVTEPEPELAAAEIYEPLEDREVVVLESEELSDIIGVSPDDLTQFYVYYSNASAGLCDVFILKPQEEKRDEVREALYSYKDQRVEEFRNYNILGAFDIAQSAVIYDQGDYLIFLMLPDNTEAQAIIDRYIPR